MLARTHIYHKNICSYISNNAPGLNERKEENANEKKQKNSKIPSTA